MSSSVGNPRRPPYVIPRGSAGLKKKHTLGAATYQYGNTGTNSRMITEVKHRSVRLVLGWETVQVLPE